MPQIKVNEIDRSVTTRVVSDDKVKILCPIISSFGPIPVTDNSGKFTDGVGTFTDVSAFERAFGYTYPQFDPMDDDYSYMYARELIKKGAAVSVVRINQGGDVAGFFKASDIPSDLNPPKKVTSIIKAATHNSNLSESVETPATITITNTATKINVDGHATGNSKANILYDTFLIEGFKVTKNTDTISGNIYCTGEEGATAGTFKTVFVFTNGTTSTSVYCGDLDPVEGELTFANSFTSVYTVTATTSSADATATYQSMKESDVWKFAFAPQIKEINAKYKGSFGNNLMISIAQINTSRLAESYQYAGISVYYIDQEVNYNADGSVASRVVNKTTLLENKIVSTNPNDPNYFEDVEFEFIEIKGTDSAREELALVWSNIEANPTSDYRYSGFPVIPFKYTDANGYNTQYNFDAMFGQKDFGTDFEYTKDTVLPKLKAGFKGYWTSTSSEGWTVDDVQAYQLDIYGNAVTSPTPENLKAGIIANIFTELANVYQQFTDPYVYDFDFITSSGLVWRKYELENGETEDDPYVVSIKQPSEATNTYGSITPVHESMRTLVETRQDCVALFDVPHDYNTKGLVEYSRILNTSYGTMHFPWCWVNSPDIAGKLILMAPSYIFLYTFLSNLINNVESQKWFPPAGVTRATARVVVKPDFEIGSVLLNEWQNDNTSRVNPIMKLKQYGYVIYGQYTNLEAIDLYTHSALESLNVRLIANVVKKKIFDSCLNLAFEPNTSNLWLKFFAQMDEYLRFMKYNDGLYDYRIVMDESTVTTDDINHLRCPGKVYIAPTRTAEFFDIDFIITGAGAVFTD